MKKLEELNIIEFPALGIIDGVANRFNAAIKNFKWNFEERNIHFDDAVNNIPKYGYTLYKILGIYHDSLTYSSYEERKEAKDLMKAIMERIALAHEILHPVEFADNEDEVEVDEAGQPKYRVRDIVNYDKSAEELVVRRKFEEQIFKVINEFMENNYPELDKDNCNFIITTKSGDMRRIKYSYDEEIDKYWWMDGPKSNHFKLSYPTDTYLQDILFEVGGTLIPTVDMADGNFATIHFKAY